MDDSGAVWPKSVICFGGRFGYKDQAETANTQLAIFDYGESFSFLMSADYRENQTWVFLNHVYFDKNANRKIPPAMA